MPCTEINCGPVQTALANIGGSPHTLTQPLGGSARAPFSGLVQAFVSTGTFLPCFSAMQVSKRAAGAKIVDQLWKHNRCVPKQAPACLNGDNNVAFSHVI